MKSLIPPFLKKGDKVCIVAPSGVVAVEKIALARQWLERQGLIVQVAPHATDNYYRFAATREARLSDLQNALDNPDYRLILCARGGYGIIQYLDNICWRKFRLSPKWIVGFSDITALHLKLQQLGYASLHAIMPVQFSWEGNEKALNSLWQQLIGEPSIISGVSHQNNQEGIAKGKLVGGNLSMIVNSLGTETSIQTQGAILFLEEVGEAIYAIDRMLWQLRRAGKLELISGLILGSFNRLRETPNEYGAEVADVIRAHITNPRIPIVFDFPAGHIADNRALMLGGQGSLVVDNTAYAIKQSAFHIESLII
ncbi:MAG: LD-carboxypeptidase [Bernardetiaceae bacterium]|nr:LD-carboxypeptidase [Bernardetiaceae bacterium]